MSAYLAALSGLRFMAFRLVKSLYLAHQSSRHRKHTRNKALDPRTENIAPMGERSGLQTHIAAMESVLLCTRRKR
jgi:hypothetical protein